MAFMSFSRFPLLAVASLSIPLGFGSAYAGSNESAALVASAKAPLLSTQGNQAAEASPSALVYQLLPRVFGNQNLTNTPWGSIEENGSGKFADIDEVVLADLQNMGVTHVWYTGVLHHASVTDYSAYGISRDDADVVKGLAGSPYAIRDYYNVNPDLALAPENRLEEFKDLITRTHKAGLKVIIDIVPNHVARHYQSISAPEGVQSLGAGDDTRLAYARNNNFYYVPGADFEVPDETNRPPAASLNQVKALQDGHFHESPAKWTGNGATSPKPDASDWYETVKLNYGVTPDGKHDFPEVPATLAFAPIEQHQSFWATQKNLPDTWYKLRDISRFWLSLGVDGFRFDMAEMVPVAFWSFLASDIKAINPEALLIAEVYEPGRYRDFIGLGKLDLLYDKVGLYDSLKAVSQHGIANPDTVDVAQLGKRLTEIRDIAPHMLHFLENHDEQRIASPEFLGSAERALPSLAVSLYATEGPFLLYFGQSLGEDGSETGGFGKPSRTSIFDYVAAPAMARYLKRPSNEEKRSAAKKGQHPRPDVTLGSASLPSELELRRAYSAMLKLAGTIKSAGTLEILPSSGPVFAFRRGQYLISANFSDKAAADVALNGKTLKPVLSIPADQNKQLAPWGVRVSLVQ
ncbi:alpha-amylase family protein [Shewanella litorisediminis]|uniref:Alpha-amylase family protein n=1 Tax=Shewanella litorisediminis TaxID=1173586 RepID=A0ABX7G861_9GAMM|nr:alpha-amylase family protein [Shewanella litorisediminis]MCL2919112.1 alpha-amylase family protein [Shewanella litorisediminis]QRH03365.1 alpha-amylase family protein [Shewanella litorisediminis]